MKFFDDEIPDRAPVLDDSEYQEKVERPSPFDVVNALSYTKQDLLASGADAEKHYPAFMVNRALSMGKDSVLFANEMNCRWHTPARLQYDFYLRALPRGRRYNKWVKAAKIDDVDVVKEYYGYSDKKATEALKILSIEQTNALRDALSKGGLATKKGKAK